MVGTYPIELYFKVSWHADYDLIWKHWDNFHKNVNLTYSSTTVVYNFHFKAV